MFVSVLTVIIAFIGLLAPATQATSLSASGSFSVTNTPSFSASMSGSYSATQSYSMTSALTQSPSYSASISYSASFNDVSFSGTMSLAPTGTFSTAPSGGGGQLQPFTNHCPEGSVTICPFWDPPLDTPTVSSYTMTVMNSSGSMLTFENIVIPELEAPQLPLSYDSTEGFIKPESTYRFQLFACTSPGNCVERYVPQVFTTNPRKRPVCNPIYLCNARCKQIEKTLIECTWTNSAITPLKRAILRVSTAYQMNTLVGLPVRGLKNITVRNPRPTPSSLRLRLPSNAIVNVQLIGRYHPTRPNNVVLRTTFFT